MKKVITFISLILFVSCLTTRSLFAFVVVRNCETAALTPPQYNTSFLKNFESVKAIQNPIADKKSPDLDRKSKVALVLALSGLVLMIGGFGLAILIGVADVGSFLIWVLGFALSIVGYAKGQKVTKDASATKMQKKRARAAKILSAAVWVVVAFLAVVYYIALNSGD